MKTQMSTPTKTSLLHSLTQNNIHTCNIPQVLDCLEITVSSIPSLNLYLYEFVQNSLDTKARRIKITIHSLDALSFSHDGESLGENLTHINGMANVFQSSKGVSSLGFMGFGFKTVYKRFMEVKVADISGWSFRFLVGENELELSPGNSIYTRNWLGAVSPEWDDNVEGPESFYSTVFHMKGITTSTHSTPLENDIKSAFFEENGSALAVLATKGLVELVVENKCTQNTIVYNLKVENNVVSLNTSSMKKEWQIFRVSYVPEDEAVRNLCQSRLKNILALRDKQDVGEIWKKLKSEHELFGLVEIKDGTYVSQGSGGNIFATLPLACKVPFQIDIQAEWLLDLSRRALRDINNNAWQMSIVKNIAKLVACFIDSLSNFRSEDSLRSAFNVLDFKNISCDLDFYSESWVSELHNLIKDIAFIPIITNDGSIQLRKLNEVFLLPSTLHKIPQQANCLFGRYVAHRNILSNGFINYLVKTKLLQELSPQSLIEDWQKNGLQNWWNTFTSNDEEEKQKRLMVLWAFMDSLYPRRVTAKLSCVLTSDGNWVTPDQIKVIDHPESFKVHDLPSKKEIYGLDALALLESSLPSPRFPEGWVNAISKASGQWEGLGRKAYEWISSFWKKVPIKPLINEAIKKNKETIDHQIMIKFAGWALERGTLDLITHVVAKHPNETGTIIVPITSSLLSKPYVKNEINAEERETIFNGYPLIVSDYLQLNQNSDVWLKIFSDLGALGSVSLDEFVSQSLTVFPDYNNVKRDIAKMLDIQYESMKEIHTTIAFGWKIWDTRFTVELNPEMKRHIAGWLEKGVSSLQAKKSSKYAEGYNRRSFYANGAVGSATWIKNLEKIEWIYVKSKGLWKKPAEANAEDALECISKELLETLTSHGLRFGGRLSA